LPGLCSSDSSQLRVIDLPSSLTTPSAHSQSRQLPLTYQWRICACLKVW
jgi:hypothetical protein